MPILLWLVGIPIPLIILIMLLRYTESLQSAASSAACDPGCVKTPCLL
jgi:hypothetical protein